MNEESAYPCPVCHTLTTLEHACPGCGRAPDPNAAAVITLDGKIFKLRTQVDEARQVHEGLAQQLAELRREREAFATAVRSAVALERSSSSLPTISTAAAAGTPVAVSVGAPAADPVVMAPAGWGYPAADRAETAPRTMQNLLFILGGLLLGTAALVFTAVAWNTYGDMGRAVILSLVTLAALAVPPAVRRRGLTATAETFAALGLFLVLLDGYAAWFVGLGGIDKTWDGSFYAGTVCLVTAMVGAGYGLLVRVRAPLFIALLAAQPVLPLYFVNSSAKLDIWALVFAAVALGNAMLLLAKPKPLALKGLTWTMHGLSLTIAGMIAIVAWAPEGTIRASIVLVAVAMGFAIGAGISAGRAHQGIASATAVLAVVAAVVRPLYERVPSDRFLVVWAGVTAAIGVLAWIAVRRLAGAWSTGARWGAAIALLPPAAVSVFWAATYGMLNVIGAVPGWDESAMLNSGYRWELPAALVLITIAGALLGNRVMRKFISISGVVILALALPGWPAVTDWAPPTIDLLVAAGLVLWALLVPGRLGLIAKSMAALFLAAHAILTGLGTPLSETLVLTAVVVFALAVSTVAPRGLLRPGVTIDGRHELGGVAAGLVDLLLPWLAFCAVAAFGGDLTTSWRTLVLVVLVLPFLGTTRSFRGYHVVACLIAALYPLWPVLPGGESQAGYASLAAVAMTLSGFGCRWAWVRWAPLLPAFVTLLWTGRSWSAVLLEPLDNLNRLWDGHVVTLHVPLTHAIALTLLLIPLAGALREEPRRAIWVTALAAAGPALIWLAYFQAPWPTIPAVSLISGLAIVAFAALRDRATVLGVAGVLLAVPGLFGALTHQWSTITALALISVTMAALAIGGRNTGVRLMGWLVGAVAKVLLAITIGATADLRPEITAYLVLIVAGILLAVAYSPLRREWGPAIEAAAHSVALVALGFCHDAPRPAAGVLALWGVAIGLTALRRQAVPRAAVAALAESVAWIVLLRAADVGTLEAYTLPIAAVGLAAGVLAARRRVDLSSWVAYGPALAAGLLPSLGAVLIEPGDLWRRLLLGIGALIVVITGAVLRRQAPFLLGAATLLVLAVHELALVWQLIDAWIPLAVFGLLLVGLAITYERRLRDLARLRDVVSRMS